MIIALLTLKSGTRTIIANTIADSVYKAGGGYNDAYTNIGFGSFFAVKIGKIKQPIHTAWLVFRGAKMKGGEYEK